MQTPQYDLVAYSLFHGHFNWHLVDHANFPLRVFSFLRDPLKRAISHYHHVVRSKNHYFHKLALELGSLGSYMRDPRTQPTVSNFQVRSIASELNPKEIISRLTAEEISCNQLERLLDTLPLGKSDHELLEIAFRRLEEMCFVGITERFDDSMALLAEVFEWPRMEVLQKENANPNPDAYLEVSADDLSYLTSINQLDLEIYRFGTALFEKSWNRSKFVYPQLHSFVSYAQNGEDVLLNRAFKHLKCGFYIDVGANDPVGDSVTKAFYSKGWRGVNIEPSPVYFSRLVGDRPDDINVNAAAGDLCAEHAFVDFPGTGLGTLDEAIGRKHMESGFTAARTTVVMRTLDNILADVDVEDIHFLKIDVEGYERQVLQGLSLTRYRPWIILVEATAPNTTIPNHQEWEPLVLQAGYHFAYFDGLNRFYVSDEHRDLCAVLGTGANQTDNYQRYQDQIIASSLRNLRWESRRQQREMALLRKVHEDDIVGIAGLTEWATSADAYGKSLVQELEAVRNHYAQERGAWAAQHADALKQIAALGEWATSADAYGKSLVQELEAARNTYSQERAAWAVQSAGALKQIEALSEWATSADAYGKSLVRELEAVRDTYAQERVAWAAQQADTTKQIAALTEWATSADTYGKSLIQELEATRNAYTRDGASWAAQHAGATDQIAALGEWATSADAYGKSLAVELEAVRDAYARDRAAWVAQHADAVKQIAALGEWATSADAYGKSLVQELESARDDQRRQLQRWENERTNAEQSLAAQIEQAANADHRCTLLAEELFRAREQLATEQAKWERERQQMNSQIRSLNDLLSRLNGYWPIRLTIRYLSRRSS